MEDHVDECDLWAFWVRKDGKIKDNYEWKGFATYHLRFLDTEMLRCSVSNIHTPTSALMIFLRISYSSMPLTF